MASKSIRHMNFGHAQHSYASNSSIQKSALRASLPIIDEAIKDMFSSDDGIPIPKCLKIVDLGCSCGPNTLSILSHIVHTIVENTHQNNLEFELYFNDLPHNDFNHLFSLFPNCKTHFLEENIRCFFYGLPSSFYHTLFPTKTLHFAFSCYSLHWLSQVPEGLGKKNKENVYMAKTSPLEVFEAYAEQYQRDLSTFLSLRGKEMCNGGHMVLVLWGRRVDDPSCEEDGADMTLLSNALLDVVAKGGFDINDLYSFNVPIYKPSQSEIERLIRDEGSFHLEKVKVSRVLWETGEEFDEEVEDKNLDKRECGKRLTNMFRAVMEPLLATHFGSSILDELFIRYADKMTEYMLTGRRFSWNLIISLSKHSE